MSETRRSLLLKIGALGGYSAAYAALEGLGVSEAVAATAAPSRPSLPAGFGQGKRVAILGAGMAGLSAAYELEKAGFICNILEGRSRVGGRIWTVRPGDTLEMDGFAPQNAEFSSGSYFNAGAGRIPHDHRRVMHYCRELGVELEVLVNECRSALVHSEGVNGGKPLQLRQVIYDTRGHLSELLAKSVSSAELDKPATKMDRDRLLEFLRRYGALDRDLQYRGSERAGFEEQPGAGSQKGRIHPAIDFGTLLTPDVWRSTAFTDPFDMQPTMFQPVGGMDEIPRAFERNLKCKVSFNAVVRKVRRSGDGVRIEYSKDGKAAALNADYCICTIPFSVLRTIDSDFTPMERQAIEGTRYSNALKIAFEAPRFWETDSDIYGGLSFTSRDTSLVWYPSTDFQKPSGIVVAAYAFDPKASALGAKPLPEQIEYARGTMETLHPGHGRSLRCGLALQWSKIPFSEGAWASTASSVPDAYRALSETKGPIFFGGEHLSHIGAWQEGAIASAHLAVASLARKYAADHV